MHPPVPARFVREMGCTVEELCTWIPGATRYAPIEWSRPEGEAAVRLPEGTVQIRWNPLPPRRIALVVLPRLQVSFDFGDMGQETRSRFMRHFDLYTQRGGG